MFSVCSHLGVVPRPGPEGGIPQSGSGGVPQQGLPHLRYPPSDLARGYPNRRYPTLGTPIRPARGVPQQEVTPPWVPPSPHQTWPGGCTPMGGVPHRVVLDVPWSVCLLRSRRRTFLLVFTNSVYLRSSCAVLHSRRHCIQTSLFLLGPRFFPTFYIQYQS